MKIGRYDYECQLVKHGFSRIGCGSNSAVYGKPGEKTLIKVVGDISWEPYVRWGIKNGFAGNFTPWVYAFHRHATSRTCRRTFCTATMERLAITISRTRREYDSHVHPRTKAAVGAVYMDSRTIDERMALEKAYPGISAFAEKAKAAGFHGDWHDENWMFADPLPDGSYGRLVLIDPSSEEMETGLKRWRPGDQSFSRGAT